MGKEGPYQMAKKANSPWFHNSNPTPFVTNEPKIGEAIEVWPCQEVGVLGQIIVIFAKNQEKLRQYICVFFVPWRAFLMKPFLTYDYTSARTRLKRYDRVGPSSLWENKSLNLYLPISSYKSDFLHFGYIVSLTLLFGLKRTIKYQAVYKKVISMPLTTFRSILGGLLDLIFDQSLNDGFIPNGQYIHMNHGPSTVECPNRDDW